MTVDGRRKTDKKRWSSSLHLGMRDIDFEQIRDEMDRYNRKVVPEMNAIGMIVLVILILVATIMGEGGPLAPFSMPMFSFCVIFGVLYALSGKVHQSKSHAVTVAYCYVTVVSLYSLTIILGPICDTEQLSMTFLVLLFAIPIIIADVPERIAIVSIIMSVVFVIASYLNKDFSLFVFDTINCGTFLIASILVEFVVQRMRLKLLMQLRQTEHERDTDGLTNVWTKDSGEQRIRDELKRYPHARGAMVIMDVDDFKQVNDRYGHDYGDVILRMVGTTLNNSFREEDILVRFGGDEFVLYLPNAESYEEVENCVDRIRKTIEGETEELPGNDTLSCSFGAAFFPDDGKDYDNLLRRADKALYLAKHLGKNKLCFYRRGNKLF